MARARNVIDVFELTAREVAEMDEDAVFEYSRRREFRLAFMNSRTRDAMFDAIVEENGISGGWFYSVTGEQIGPYPSRADATTAAGRR